MASQPTCRKGWGLKVTPMWDPCVIQVCSEGHSMLDAVGSGCNQTTWQENGGSTGWMANLNTELTWYIWYTYIYIRIFYFDIYIYIYKEYITYIYILRAQTVFLLSTICKRESLQQYFFGSEVSWILQVAQFSRPPLAMDARIMALCLFRTHSMWHHMGIFLIGYLIHLWPPWKMQAHFPLELVVNLHLFVNLWAKNGKSWRTDEKQ